MRYILISCVGGNGEKWGKMGKNGDFFHGEFRFFQLKNSPFFPIFPQIFSPFIGG